ncbi:response regulator [Candidatus Pacearchaeota archaeon]|nr:response regulator [Candidatus Pacearchaeota archaeon]
MANIKVALIGNHVDTITNMSNYLRSKGIETCWAYLGNEAVSLCKNNNPDILIMDSTMSGMGAFEAAKLLPKQKIIVMTGLSDIEFLASHIKNIVGVVKKPVDLEELEKLIRKNV